MELELDAAQRAALAAAALALIESRRERRDDGAPIHTPPDAERVAQMLAPPPEEAIAPEAVFARLQAAAESGWSKTDGGDLAYIPSGGLDSGAIAAWLASALHVFTGAAFESPALVALEESVLRWLAGVLGLPPDAEGVLLSGGSLANQTAIVCARAAAGFDDDVARRGVAYLSKHAHHSLHKALRLCGVPAAGVRVIDGELASMRLDVAALRDAIAADRAAGRRPWLVVGSAGGTDTGAIDDLVALAQVAREHGAWLHVDAAYGGAFALTERGRTRLAGIDRADSITVDAHKGLLLPYGVGALLVRRSGALAHAHAGAGVYMRDVPRAEGLPHYFERGPELTRPFRGLLLWLPLQLHGVARFRAVLDRSLDLATAAAARLRELPGVEVIGEPQLSVVAFRARAGDAATARLVDAIHASGRFHVSTTTLDGRAAIRLAFLHPRTGMVEVERVLELVRGADGRAVTS